MVPKIYQSMPEGVQAYFTEELPLGPVAAEHIQDQRVAAFLLNPETTAFRGVMAGASIILGRRGAGKSALLDMLVDRKALRKHLDEFYRNSPAVLGLGASSELSKEYFVTIRIDAPTEMGEVDRIIRQIKFPTLEASADAWRKRIVHNILLHFLNHPRERTILPNNLRTLLGRIDAIRKFDVGSLLRIRDLVPAIKEAHLNRDQLLGMIEESLRKSGRRALVLIDTMEEYRIRESAVVDVVGGLLYEISRHAGNAGAFEIKAALPTEIYRIVHDAGAPGKYAIPTEFIHWTPNTLTEIVAHRAMIMARCRFGPTFDRMCSHLPKDAPSIDSRSAVNILSEVLPRHIENEAGHKEEALNAILRHTLLLPRQILNLLSIALKVSFRERGQAPVTREQLEGAVDLGCARVIGEVYSAYRHVYPDIGVIGPPFLRYCRSVSSYGDLQRAYNETVKGRFGHEYASDFSSFLSAIVDCGLVGVKTRETPKYIEAKFAYNFVGELNFTSRDVMVLHPAVRRHYDIGQDTQGGKAVLPFGAYLGEAA